MTGAIIFAVVIVLAKIVRDYDQRRASQPQVKTDQYVEFKSSSGCTIVCPSMWSNTETKESWLINASDGQAQISVYTVRKSSGNAAQIREQFLEMLAGDSRTRTEQTEWKDIEIGSRAASKIVIGPSADSTKELTVYVIDYSEHVYVLVLQASKLTLSLNGVFYENIVLTFKGVQ